MRHKQLFDNRYGPVRARAVTVCIRATNRLLAAVLLCERMIWLVPAGSSHPAKGRRARHRSVRSTRCGRLAGPSWTVFRSCRSPRPLPLRDFCLYPDEADIHVIRTDHFVLYRRMAPSCRTPASFDCGTGLPPGENRSSSTLHQDFVEEYQLKKRPENLCPGEGRPWSTWPAAGRHPSMSWT